MDTQYISTSLAISLRPWHAHKLLTTRSLDTGNGNDQRLHMHFFAVEEHRVMRGGAGGLDGCGSAINGTGGGTVA
jgi:hypothetical protein